MRPHRRIRFLLAGLLALCLFPNLSWAGVSVPTPPPSETPPIAPILLARTNPVTFAFEATIVDLGLGANRQLLFPIPLMPGDTIRGEFAYDFKPGRVQHQDGGVTFKLGALELFSPTFLSFLDNNGSITAGDHSVTSDSFGFNCYKPSLCEPSPIDGAIRFSWSAFFNLVDTSASLLDTHAQRPDLAVLNSFSRRNLILTFISEESGLSTGTVFAEVGPLVLIPEPSSVLLLIFALAALVIARRRMM